MLTPVTPPCYLTISQSENCAGADHIPCNPPPYLAFIYALPKPLGSSGFFLEHEPPISLHGPAINLSLLHTPMFQFVWPHYASGTRTCSNNIIREH